VLPGVISVQGNQPVARLEICWQEGQSLRYKDVSHWPNRLVVSCRVGGAGLVTIARSNLLLCSCSSIICGVTSSALHPRSDAQMRIAANERPWQEMPDTVAPNFALGHLAGVARPLSARWGELWRGVPRAYALSAAPDAHSVRKRPHETSRCDERYVFHRSIINLPLLRSSGSKPATEEQQKSQ
jgi:hypothetical protein